VTDAIVIGAGPNGLAAAIRLAEAGHSVLICEAADHPGGALHSEELTLPGFVHDVFSAVHPAGAASPVFARMPLHEHGLEWVHPRVCAASPLPEGRAAVLYRSLDDTVRSLNALHPGDGDRWAEFVGPFLEAYPQIRETMLAGFPPLVGPLKLLLRKGPVRLLQFSRLLPETSVSLTGRLFEGSEARVWMHGAAMHGDTPPDGWGSAIAGFYLTLLGHAVGWPSPRGGAGKFTAALVSYLRSLGGEVRVNAPVARVLHDDDRVRGVELEGGERLEAATVVADVMPHALVGLTNGALDGLYGSMLKRYRYGAATIKVDWALDGPIPWTNEETRGAGTIHLAGDEPEMLDAVRQSYSHLPERPFLLLGQQTVADPTRAPEGKHTAWAYTHGPTHGVDYAAETERHVERMEAQVERYAPGFRDRILARHVLGPADLEARNRNLVGGDVGGGSYRLRQVVFRPVPKLSPYRTPLRGLFLGSAATFPGGAVHGVPGDAAARAALRGR
jgi:phytoene dehydrogenase-like protein